LAIGYWLLAIVDADKRECRDSFVVSRRFSNKPWTPIRYFSTEPFAPSLCPLRLRHFVEMSSCKSGDWFGCKEVALTGREKPGFDFG